jgi:hypothetical protein
MTQAADQLERVLTDRFPGIRYGRVNCRRIAGSTTWSQHAWPGGNARDLYAPTDSPQPMEFLDWVTEWLENNRDALSIRLILWRAPDHYSHAHVDFWPTGQGTPPCAGGVETWRYSDGTLTFQHDPEPENGDYMFTHYQIGHEYPEYEEISWFLYLIDGGSIDPNENSSQIQTRLPWKTNVRLVQQEDFDMIAQLIGLSNVRRIRMADEGLYRYGLEIASLRERAYV